jgi:hypothetical protein
VCDFKQASTDFAVTYVKDKYMEEQASKTDIKTYDECISGSISIYGVLLSPNVEAGANEAVSPSIYNRGLVRVCATDNPGKGTDAKWNTNESKWREVGYCDDSNMKCWLDTDSVKEAIRNLGIQESVLGNLNEQAQQILSAELSITPEEVDLKIQEINKEPDQMKKIKSMNR